MDAQSNTKQPIPMKAIDRLFQRLSLNYGRLFLDMWKDIPIDQVKAEWSEGLAGYPYDDISVMVHPQSVIHSMVEFTDGSTLAQASPPDMRLPIALALGWPDRVPDAAPAVDWTTSHTWEFAPLDDDAFPAVRLAMHAGRTGRCLPAVYNAANEELVAAFVDGRLPFLGIVDTLEQVLAEAPDFGQPGTVDEVHAAEEWARARATELVHSHVRA